MIANCRARLIVCENPDQAAKIADVRERLPAPPTVVLIEGQAPGALALADVRRRGAGVDEAELEHRVATVSADDAFTIIYTSGTTGQPKGCVLTHGNYRAMMASAEAAASVGEDEVAYLYLPLAHYLALLMQLIAFDVGATLAYFSGDTKRIVSELNDVRPTFLPSVPRIFEKIFALVSTHRDPAFIRQATEVGLRVRALRGRGEQVPADLQAHFDDAEQKLFGHVRQAFGGRLRQALSGAAPIAPEILEFFHACGVPVLQGYGLTETSTAATFCTLENDRLGTVGKPLPGVEVAIADDGEVLVHGPNIFRGYYRDPEATAQALHGGWLRTGDLGSLDEDGYLTITGRKKDIIITAGGKNLTPANLENDLKQSHWISYAVMHGDRRPYPVALVTLDPEEMSVWAAEHGKPHDLASLATDPDVRALIQGEIDHVNARYAQVEQIKRFAILEHDLSQETGELTPTLKVKRNVVQQRHAALLDSLYH